MPEPLRVELFCEDRGHELFVRALVERLAEAEDLVLALEARNAQGGHGRAITELKTRQKILSYQPGRPDLLIVVIDGNCEGWNAAHKSITGEVKDELFPHFVVGCPDPHIERWCMADRQAFRRVVGTSPPADPGKCDRGFYKQLFLQALEKAGQIILTGPMEFAPDLVAEMDLHQAGKEQTSLGHFIGEIQSKLRLLSGGW